MLEGAGACVPPEVVQLAAFVGNVKPAEDLPVAVRLWIHVDNCQGVILLCCTIKCHNIGKLLLRSFNGLFWRTVECWISYGAHDDSVEAAIMDC